MPDARPLFLALALEAAPMGAVRLMRSSGQKSAYVATLVVTPDRDANREFENCPAADCLPGFVGQDSPGR